MLRRDVQLTRPRKARGQRRARYRWQLLLLPAGIFAVHQLRYLLAYGSHAGSELSAHGDRYTQMAAVMAITLAAIALAAGLLRLLAVSRGRGRGQLGTAPWWLLWLGLTAVLVVGFWALETLEVVLEPHHVGTVMGAFGDGGWWALPAAIFVAGVMTIVARGGRALLAIVARGRPSGARRTTSRWLPHPLASAPMRRPMASCAAGRAPPVRLFG